jgi:iron complex outermembrane receptor protein
VTGIKLVPTQSGLAILLETLDRKPLQSSTTVQGNQLIVEIPNAQLQLPEQQAFQQKNPASGIAAIEVIATPTRTVRIIVTGVDGSPKSAIATSPTGLTLSITPIAEAPEEEVIGTGASRSRYSVPTGTTATKLDLPLLDIPQSIQVIPKEVIQDRQVTRLNELTDNVSGVQRVPGYGGLSSVGTRIRGFTLQFENLRNGFRDFGYQSPRDVANVERVEILKGPASVLYGGGVTAFSGVVNTVTKKPSEQPFRQVGMTFGHFSLYRPTVDLTGPLNRDRSLLYRFVGAYENSGGFRDFSRNESSIIAPSLTWKISPRTQLTLEYERQSQNYFFDNGYPTEPEFLRLPRNRFILGEPNLNRASWITNSGTYELQHEFSNDWKFRQGFNILQSTGGQQSAFGFDPLESDRRTLPRVLLRSDEQQTNYTLQNEIYGKFKTGSVRHNVLFGIEWAQYKYDFTFFSADLAPIDILNPVYGATPGEFGPPDRTKYGANNLGIYAQNLLEITPQLKVLAGIRFDVNWSYRNNFEAGVEDLRQVDSGFSPRLGIVYQPSPKTSLYASWARSFAPQFQSRSRTNAEFEPVTGEQFEVGIKQQFFNDRFLATLALFQLTRQNVLTTDPVDPTFNIQTGEQRSRGVELDLVGQILPGWNIIANYAYTDAIVTQDNSIPVGDRLDGTPKHSASFWTTYEIQKGALQGLGFGAGLVFVGDRDARLPNALTLPSYVRADAAVFYRRNNLRFGINIKNISNTKYFEAIENFFIIPAASTTVLGTISVDF